VPHPLSFDSVKPCRALFLLFNQTKGEQIIQTVVDCDDAYADESVLVSDSIFY